VIRVYVGRNRAGIRITRIGGYAIEYGGESVFEEKALVFDEDISGKLAGFA
jgi:hypothetical protein